MDDSMDKNFMESACACVRRAGGYAIEKNLISIFNDIDNRQDPDEPPELTVTMKMTIRHPRKLAMSAIVKEVSWKRQYKTSDKNFPIEEIDLMQPELFGDILDDAMQIKQIEEDAKEEDEFWDHALGFDQEVSPIFALSMHNLMSIASKDHCDIYRPCDWIKQPMANRSVLHWDHNKLQWECVLCPDEASVANVLEAADKMGGFVYWHDNNLSKNALEWLAKWGYLAVAPDADNALELVKNEMAITKVLK